MANSLQLPLSVRLELLLTVNGCVYHFSCPEPVACVFSFWHGFLVLSQDCCASTTPPSSYTPLCEWLMLSWSRYVSATLFRGGNSNFRLWIIFHSCDSASRPKIDFSHILKSDGISYIGLNSEEKSWLTSFALLRLFNQLRCWYSVWIVITACLLVCVP